MLLSLRMDEHFSERKTRRETYFREKYDEYMIKSTLRSMCNLNNYIINNNNNRSDTYRLRCFRWLVQIVYFLLTDKIDRLKQTRKKQINMSILIDCMVMRSQNSNYKIALLLEKWLQTCEMFKNQTDIIDLNIGRVFFSVAIGVLR